MAYVCNLHFFEPGTHVFQASGPAFADGEVFTSVLTDVGYVPKFHISPASSPTDPSYASRTVTSGHFTGLVPGSYIVNCRVNDICKKEITVTVGYVITYTPRFRIEHDSIVGGLKIRIDIEDRDYSDEVIEVTAQGEPCELRWANEGSDSVFTPLIGSELIVNLKSPTDGYFDLLNSYDEKRFRATYYVDYGSGFVQKWQGFLVPMNSTEPYTLEKNFDVSFTFSDGLADLDRIPFSDDFGNSPSTRITILDAIIFCLKKTGLELSIWETVNFYPVGISTAGNYSTIEQVYFDPKVYLQPDGTMESCGSVLRSLLTNFAARLTQSDGVWAIDCPTLKTGSTTATRKFDYDGGEIGGGDESYRIMLRANSAVAPKITWKDQTQMKGHQTMYGQIELTYDLGVEEVNNVLASGDFEDEDIENGQLKNWQVESFSAVVAEIEKITDRGENNFNALKIPFRSDVVQQALISSLPVALQVSTEPIRLRFSFDTLVRLFPLTPNNYIYIDYQLALQVTGGDLLRLSPVIDTNYDNATLMNSDASTLVDGEYLRTYIDQAGEWKTITSETVIDPANWGGIFPGGELQVIFRVNANPVYDVDGITALRAVPTFPADAYPVRNYANKIRVRDVVPGPLEFVRYYELEGGDDDENDPDIIVPTDNSTMVWKLKKSITNPDQTPTFQKTFASAILFDNVIVQYLPGNQEPDKTEVSTVVMNANVKNTLPITFRHGDLPSDTNYQNISRGWLSYLDIDGAHQPTSAWKFRGQSAVAPPPGRSLIQLLRGLYQGQYNADRWKLTGNAVCLGVLPFIGLPMYEVRTGRIYTVTSPLISSRRPEVTIEMIESILGAPIIDESTPDPDPDVEPPVAIGDFAAADFDPEDFLAV